MRIFITGTAGFIGFHLAKLLLKEGHEIYGYDGFSDYYDVLLKHKRNQMLLQNSNFNYKEALLEDRISLDTSLDMFKPDIIVHLAAQAGVRYSLENPHAYVSSNIEGTLNILEGAKRHKISHLLMASTSSVYGANTEMPFKETERTDTQLSIYAATKKANESMGHSYSHLFEIPVTMFRFFTVYGTWGRPDLALYKFVDAILDGRPIDIYNNGQMYRDFTYVDDLVRAISLLMECKPETPKSRKNLVQGDSISPVAPFRTVNIGNNTSVKLLDFIEVIENELNVKAIRNYMGMQPGDVPGTWADANLLKNLTGYKPQTSIEKGIHEFIVWFRKYYNK
jgi:UDP-glucuronate 4-epimerase